MGKFKFDLGVEARDNATKFTGVITGRAEYSSEQSTYRLEGLDSTGRPISDWYEEGRLEDFSRS